MHSLSLNADVDRAARIDSAAAQWIASPTVGVERVMLERDGGEVALATSIVRYAAGTHFPAHGHDAGEEFLVLQGEFSDEHGIYAAGTYVRNPPGFFHAPFSRPGCTLFVKLRQMAEGSRGERLVLPPTLQQWQTLGQQGQAHCMLHAGPRCEVSLERLPSGASLALETKSGGAELFVLSGSVVVDAPGDALLSRWSWWRHPPDSGPLGITSQHGAMLWLKRGHLDRLDG
jgi:anti-sigma factor ChrR (cupin superfamily)